MMKRRRGPEKKAKKSKKVEGAFLEKDELIRLMDWKLKYGFVRPTLMGMVRSNQGNLVRTTTSSAYSSLASLDNSFPRTSLETLIKSLRGVGPATASLILSLIPSDGRDNQVPFYSDELFFWLCLKRYPSSGGEQQADMSEDPQTTTSKGRRRKAVPVKAKYNIHEYRQIYDATRDVRERLNRPNQDLDKEDENHAFSVVDIEKAAFVIGHLEVSGYSESKNPATEELPREPKDAKPEEEEIAAVPGITEDKAKGGSKKRKR